MKKSILATSILLILFTINSFAQIRTSIDAGIKLPTADLKTAVDRGYGGNLTFYYKMPLSPVTLAFSAGYNKWNYKSTAIYHGYYYYTIPLTAGVRYFLSRGILVPYFGGDIGVAISNNNVPNSKASTNFVYSPVVGLRFNFSPIGLIALDINAKYNVMNMTGITYAWFGVNAGISFGL